MTRERGQCRQALFAAGFLSDMIGNGKKPWDGAAEQTNKTAHRARPEGNPTRQELSCSSARRLVHGTWQMGGYAEGVSSLEKKPASSRVNE